MSIKPILLLGLVFLCIDATSQNLVPNHSFERLKNLPVKENPKNTFEYEPSSGYIPYKVNLENWFAATLTTPDLRINSPAYYDCQARFKNCDKARTGNNCVGIITSMTNEKVKTYREYIQIKLIKPLQPNEITHIEFWVAKERQAKLVSNNIGAHFSMKPIRKKTKEVVDLVPQINYDTIVNEDKKKWIKIARTFIPDKPYKYLLIGNFFGNKETETIRFKKFNGSPYTPPYAYYLVDDIRVWQDIEEEPLFFEEQLVTINKAIELKNIEFDFDKSNLLPASIIEIEKLLQFLTDNPAVKIKIQGHTDAWGNDNYNQSLSEARAKTVYQYLINKGIESNRLSYEGFGESIPIAENTIDRFRRKNRRVEFIVLSNSK